MSNNSISPDIASKNKLEYQSIQTDKLTPHPEASALFQVEEELLVSITSEMKEKGFKGDRPVSAVRDSEGRLFVYDGNTRLKAAIEANIDEIPVYINEDLDAKNVDAVLTEAVKAQVQRRPSELAVLLIAVETLLKTESELADERKKHSLASIEAKPGKAAEKIASILGISASSVERLIKVSKDPEIRKGILNSEYDSINTAYNAVKAKDKAAAKPGTEKTVQSSKTNPEETGGLDDDPDDTEAAGQELLPDEPQADDGEDEVALSFLVTSRIVRKILALISDEMSDDLIAIVKEAHCSDLSKLIAERIKDSHKAA